MFQVFKNWWESKDRDTKTELADLATAASVFKGIIAPDSATRFGLFCARLRALDTAMLTPLILYLRHHHDEDSCELLKCITALESYLIRRHVCGLTAKGYNRIFLRLLGTLVESAKADAKSIREYLLAMKGDSQLWPDDRQFEDCWLSRPMYQAQRLPRTRMLLEALELAKRTEKQEDIKLPTGLSIEHVLPQGWNPITWPISDDTDTAKAGRNQMLHTIGNLTLLTLQLNASVSNGPFKNKRPEITKSLLTLNAYFQGPEFTKLDPTWSESEIVARGKSLFALALKIWPYGEPS